MVLWSLLVDKVHRNATTGIDWNRAPRGLSDIRDISACKLAALWTTWAIIGIVYTVFRFYWTGTYAFAMRCFGFAAPVLFIVSPLYILWLDQRLSEPRDDLWAFGAWLTGRCPADRDAIKRHARSWAVKAFFLAFMISIVPGNFFVVVDRSWEQIVDGPVALADFLIAVMFMVDVAIATVGYILTLRVLDAHIRTATPYAEGWVAALICYPPFVLMGNGSPLDYHVGTMGDQSWMFWLADNSLILSIWGTILVALTGIYAWATVAFGLRFSNLTHRGIITHGPYAWVRHPAYLAKNAFWWLSTLPLPRDDKLAGRSSQHGLARDGFGHLRVARSNGGKAFVA